MNKLSQKFLDAPPVKWDALVTKYNTKNQTDVEALHHAIVVLEKFSVSVARLASYLRSRYLLSVHGDQDAAHAKAVKMQNKAAAQVRKALGYTSTKDDINF